MKNRKISTAIAEKVMTGVLTILIAISVTACGSTKEQANSAATEVTEAVVTTETESETATEAKVENEVVTETETETEEPVLFRVKVTNSNGAYLTDQPSDKEYHDFILTDYGTEFDVLEVFNNEAEGYTFYRVNWEGKSEFILDEDVRIIEEI